MNSIERLLSEPQKTDEMSHTEHQEKVFAWMQQLASLDAEQLRDLLIQIRKEPDHVKRGALQGSEKLSREMGYLLQELLGNVSQENLQDILQTVEDARMALADVLSLTNSGSSDMAINRIKRNLSELLPKIHGILHIIQNVDRESKPSSDETESETPGSST